MARVYVALGSNIDPERMISGALDTLEARWGPLERSPVYRTPAVGFDGPAFLNLVVSFTTLDPPARLRRALQQIEGRFGRGPEAAGFHSRTLDLDLLLYGSLVVDEPDLRLPHPDILRYAFVLEPLALLAPNLQHPIDGRTMAELDQALDLPPHEMERVELSSVAPPKEGEGAG